MNVNTFVVVVDWDPEEVNGLWVFNPGDGKKATKFRFAYMEDLDPAEAFVGAVRDAFGEKNFAMDDLLEIPEDTFRAWGFKFFIPDVPERKMIHHTVEAHQISSRIRRRKETWKKIKRNNEILSFLDTTDASEKYYGHRSAKKHPEAYGNAWFIGRTRSISPRSLRNAERAVDAEREWAVNGNICFSVA